MLEERDAEELVLVLAGYFNLATDLDLAVTHVKSTSDEQCEYNFRGILLNVLVLGYFGDFGYIRPFSPHKNRTRDFLGSQCSTFVNMSIKLMAVNFAFGRTMFPAWKLFCRCGMSQGGSRD